MHIAECKFFLKDTIPNGGVMEKKMKSGDN